MGVPLKLLYAVGFIGVVGLVGTLKVIVPTRITEFFWFRSLPQRQGKQKDQVPWMSPDEIVVITNGQQDCADRRIAGILERATLVIEKILSVREGLTGTEKNTVKAIERLKASLEEMGQLQDAPKACLNHLLKEIMNQETMKRQAEEIKRLQARLEKQEQLLQETMAALSSAVQEATKREQFIHDLLATTNQRQHERTKQVKKARRTSAYSEQISMLTSPTVVNKADSNPVTEVVELLRMLNAHIDQAASLISDSLAYPEPPISSKESEYALNELIGYIGPWLC